MVKRGLLALGVAVACQNTGPERRVPADSQDAVTESPRFTNDSDALLAPTIRGTSRIGLVSALGRPDSIDANPIPNRHVQGVIDTIVTFHYPDLVATFHRPGGGGEILAGLVVTGNRHLQFPSIGQMIGDVEAHFGSPDERTDTSFAYLDLGRTEVGAGGDGVEFFHAGGRVHRVRFYYYVD